VDTYDFLADPRAITLQERRATAALRQREQDCWHPRLQQLSDGAVLAADFPAFLLATPAFAPLAHALQSANARSQLPAAVRDELDWFLSAFADYLRTVDGEDAFAEPPTPQFC
jgi:hypothetical protein